MVRAADLSGLSSQYDIFLENALKIKAEYELLTGKSVDWDNWKLATIKLLKEFVSREIELTDFFFIKGWAFTILQIGKHEPRKILN